jgi:hypothetical protein
MLERLVKRFAMKGNLAAAGFGERLKKSGRRDLRRVGKGVAAVRFNSAPG